jgi:DNA modification methylase
MRLGIQSHYGRDHTQGFAPFPVVAGVDTKTREVRTTAISPQAGDGSLAYAEQQSYVSVFDPVLCEVAYRWWSPTGGAILDPFAGGSVRGIVAAILDRDYLGIDISAEQVAANDAQAAQIVPDHEHAPRWIVGDATKLADVIPSGYDCDFVFSCPPYGDLEVYSDDPRDLSAMTPAGFEDAYRAAIAQAVARLRPDRFACFVVGEYRRDDVFAGLIPTTISAFRDAGMDYYNEAAFITPYGSLPVRAARTFSPGRKLGKTHQNVLVFVKGDARCAVEACGPIGVDLPDDMRDDDDAGA